MAGENRMVKKLVLWILVVGCMGLIFSFSAQKADDSNDLSEGLLVDILEFLNLELPVETVELLNVFIRKTAHFSVYALLGFLIYLLIRIGYGKNGKTALGLAPFFSGIYAATDEIHQLFVPGRSGQIGDVFIDFSGAVVGAILGTALLFLLRGRTKND